MCASRLGFRRGELQRVGAGRRFPLWGRRRSVPGVSAPDGNSDAWRSTLNRSWPTSASQNPSRSGRMTIRLARITFDASTSETSQEVRSEWILRWTCLATLQHVRPSRPLVVAPVVKPALNRPRHDQGGRIAHQTSMSRATVERIIQDRTGARGRQARTEDGRVPEAATRPSRARHLGQIHQHSGRALNQPASTWAGVCRSSRTRAHPITSASIASGNAATVPPQASIATARPAAPAA